MKDEINNSFFDNINGYKLDLEQRKVVLDNSRNLLVVAGAGSGKTLTIIGKIKYLIEKRQVNYHDILCISCTHETVNNLKNKLEYDIDIYTFHKLSLEILKDNHVYYQVAASDFLEYVTNEYFESIIYDNHYLNYVLDYFKYYIKKEFTYENLKNEFREQFLVYKKLIIKFINLIKSNNKKINDLKKYILKNKYRFNKKQSYKNKCLLIIILDIYRIYLEDLNSSLTLDFDMMIEYATRVVNKYGMKRYYKYIIIDEFQDTSIVRYQLIKEISKSCDSKILCVGDDFQSIYKFSGCTMDLFINFKKYFQDSHILYLKNTYRNSLELIKIAYKFIIKNPYQLNKRLLSNKRLSKPIKIVYYTKSNYKIRFLRLLDKLIFEGEKDILVLGRCNNDLNFVWEKLDDCYIKYKDLNIKYLTVHRAKGLEASSVIVLNLSDELLGFPNKIKDEKIINEFFKNKDNFLYAEERRLFYVALTRTKNNVYLMTKKEKESIFVKEIKKKCEILDI